MDDTHVTGSFNNISDEKERIDEGIIQPTLDPLKLDIEDKELVTIIDKRISDIRGFYETNYNLYERRKTNETYYFGRQFFNDEDKDNLKDYNSRFQDNLLYEIESNLKPVAMSRLPDLIVTPGNDSEQARLIAQEVSKAIDTQIKTRQNREVLGLAYHHLPVYFTAVLKARWDPELDDYVFEVIHPDLIDVDYSSPSKKANTMKLISQIIPLTIEQVLMRFPNKRDDFIKELSKDGIAVQEGKLSYKQMATEIKIREVWFKWYKKISKTEYEPIWGVTWKYHDCILAKMKDPNFDYEGDKQVVVYDEENQKRPATNDELMQAMMLGQMPMNMKVEQVYYNYFEKPEFPFYFWGYDQWGKQPYDETSRIEQNIKNQEALDHRGRQIEETLNNRGLTVWSKTGGLNAADVGKIDPEKPNTVVLVDGPANQAFQFVPPERPDQAEYADQERIKTRMHELAGDQSINGTLQTDVATSNQIGRESNFTKADDMVEDTINSAAEWMARWAMQFIRLRYTQDKFKKILGIAGEVVFLKLNRNMIDQGMVVMIKASGTDRLEAKNNAINLSKLGMIDTVNFLRDMGYPDYEERARMLLMEKQDPGGYMLKYVTNDQTSLEMAHTIEQDPEQEMQAQMPGQQIQMGNSMQGMPQEVLAAPVTAPQNPTPTNTSQIPAMPSIGAPEASPRSIMG